MTKDDKKILKSYLIDFRNDCFEEALEEEYGVTKGAFKNGFGYFQHNKKYVIKYKKYLMNLAYDITSANIFKRDPEEVNTHGIAGKFVDECGDKELAKYWFRLICIDDDYKEWGQPFYVNGNAGKKDISLNNVVNKLYRKERIEKIIKAL